MNHLIGVEDYDTLVECLTENFFRAFPDYDRLTDPQNMIQLMSAAVMSLRNKALEDCALIFHEDCGGIVTGKLVDGIFSCEECGSRMTGMVGSNPPKALDTFVPDEEMIPAPPDPPLGGAK